MPPPPKNTKHPSSRQSQPKTTHPDEELTLKGRSRLRTWAVYVVVKHFPAPRCVVSEHENNNHKKVARLATGAVCYLAAYFFFSSFFRARVCAWSNEKKKKKGGGGGTARLRWTVFVTPRRDTAGKAFASAVCFLTGVHRPYAAIPHVPLLSAPDTDSMLVARAGTLPDNLQHWSRPVWSRPLT